MPPRSTAATDPLLSEAIEVSPGAEVVLPDIQVQAIPAGKLRVRLVGLGGISPAGIAFSIRRRGHVPAWPLLFRRLTDAVGIEFAIIVPDVYEAFLRLQTPYGEVLGRATASVSIGDVRDVDVLPEAAGSLSGRINLAKESAGNPLSALSVQLLPEEGTLAQRTIGAVNADGRFVVNSVHPVTYEIRLAGTAEGNYISRAEFNSEDLQGLNMTIDKTPAGPLEIFVNPDGAAVVGTVVDSRGSAGAGALVVLVPDVTKRSRADLFRSVVADQKGDFKISSIAPGAYTVFAWGEILNGAYFNPEFLKRFEEQGVILKLTPYSVSNCNLTLLETPPARK